MFISPIKMGLSQTEIDRIVEILYKEREAGSTCPDCGVKPGELHQPGCDVEICENCGVQMLQCECENPINSTWSGLWPGIKECYEQKLICWDTATSQWCFDLNTWYANK
jgi:hypothetical protein